MTTSPVPLVDNAITTSRRRKKKGAVAQPGERKSIGMHLLLAIAAIYFLLCWPLTLASRRLETRLAVAYKR